MRFSLRFFLIVVAGFMLTIGCMPDSSTSTTTETPHEIGTHKTTQGQLPISTIAIDENYLQKEVPLLDSLLSADKRLHKTVNTYAFNVRHAGEIVKNEMALKQLFDFRNDSILPNLTEYLLKPLEGELYFEVGEQLEKELNHIGLSTVSAEGMFLDLAQHPMLQKEVATHASEPYKLYQAFNDAQAASMGGEYTFLNLSAEQQMIRIGEKMRKNFGDNEYTRQIEKDFRFALRTMTDVHKLQEASGGNFIFGDLHVDFYPYATDAENYTGFIKDHTDSQYHGVVQNIYKNVSEIAANKGGGYSDLYLVVTDWLAANDDEDAPPCEAATQTVYEYLDKGIDIPHAVALKKEGEVICAVTYRFYATRKKAEQALATIKPQAPDAKVYHAVYYNNELMWGVEE